MKLYTTTRHMPQNSMQRFLNKASLTSRTQWMEPTADGHLLWCVPITLYYWCIHVGDATDLPAISQALEASAHRGLCAMGLKRHVCKPRNTKIDSNHWKLRQGKEGTSNLSSFKGSETLPTPWGQTSSLQDDEKICSCCAKPPSLWYFAKKLRNCRKAPKSWCEQQLSGHTPEGTTATVVAIIVSITNQRKCLSF